MSQYQDAAITDLQKHFAEEFKEVYYKDCPLVKMFAGGAKHKRIKWDGDQLEVPLGLPMEGTMTAHAPTDTNRTGETTLGKMKTKKIVYTYAMLQHFFRYGWDIGQSALDPDRMKSKIKALALMMETQQKTMLRLMQLNMWLGKNMIVVDKSTHVASATTITIPAGTNTQYLAAGMVIEDGQGLGIVSGAVQSGLYGVIGSLSTADGVMTITLNAAMTNAWTDQPLYLAGAGGKAPLGYIDLVTKGNTIGDLNRTTYPQWDPRVLTEPELAAAGFYDDPCAVLVDLATDAKMNCGERPDIVRMHPKTQSWMASKYQSRLKVDQGTKLIGFDPEIQISKDLFGITDYDCPLGAFVMENSKNIGVAPFDNLLPAYYEGQGGQRVAGSGDYEMGLRTAFQLYPIDPRNFTYASGLVLTRK